MACKRCLIVLTIFMLNGQHPWDGYWSLKQLTNLEKQSSKSIGG